VRNGGDYEEQVKEDIFQFVFQQVAILLDGGIEAGLDGTFMSTHALTS
jgi:hypothetical protein